MGCKGRSLKVKIYVNVVYICVYWQQVMITRCFVKYQVTFISYVLRFVWRLRLFYGLEPHSEEFTKTECGVNYQLLAVIIEVAQWVTPSFSRQPPATANGVRDGRSNWLVAPPPSWAVPLSSTYCTVLTRPTNRMTCCTNRDSNARPRVCQTNALPVGHSGYL